MPPIWSSLDAAEIIRAAFDEATGTFRTTATAIIIGGDVTVDIDGVYNALINPDPDNIGLIAHNRVSSPLDSDQVNRITSVNNITVHALDVALHHSDATDIDSGNPLFISAIDLDIRNLDQSLDSIRIGDGTNFFTSTNVSGKQGLDVNIINASVIIADPVTVNQGTNPWIVDGSGFTQPISGTVTANQGTSPWVIGDGGGSITVDGTVTANQGGAPWSQNITQVGGSLLTLGQKTMVNSIPVVIALDQSSIPVQLVSSTIKTYSASVTGLATAVLGATDIFTITGSGTQTVKVKKIRVTVTRSSSTTNDVLLIKRSTANSGGTSSAAIAVSHDSNNAAATATVLSYTANPTLGTAVGTMRVQKQFANVLAKGSSDVINWEFGQDTSQGITLRGTSQVLAVNLNRTIITTPSYDIYIEWTEE